MNTGFKDARGYSAIRPEMVARLVDFLNLGITPAITLITLD